MNRKAVVVIDPVPILFLLVRLYVATLVGYYGQSLGDFAAFGRSLTIH